MTRSPGMVLGRLADPGSAVRSTLPVLSWLLSWLFTTWIATAGGKRPACGHVRDDRVIRSSDPSGSVGPTFVRAFPSGLLAGRHGPAAGHRRLRGWRDTVGPSPTTSSWSE